MAGGRGAAAMAPRARSSAPAPRAGARPAGLGLAAAAALGCAAAARAAGGRRGGRVRAGAQELPWEARVGGCRLLARPGCGRQPGAHDRSLPVIESAMLHRRRQI